MRPDRVVAGIALLVILALVAVPGAAGHRTADAPPVPADALQAVLLETSGSAAMTTLDPAYRSAQTVTPEARLTEPAPAATVGSRSKAAQPGARLGVIVINPWHHDPEVSWYGPGFYGSGTACGQTYTKTLMGVAHRTLPCGTLVTFRANGRTVTVPVIDRGPYVAGREWDLSGALCTYLRHCYTGPIDWKLP